MKNPKFELFDVLPFDTRPHTAHELALAQCGAQTLRVIRTFKDVDEVVKDIISDNGPGECNSALEDALKKSAVYCEWQNSMPFLKDVPNIHSYRVKPKKKNNAALINDELIKFGGLLPKGQVLFRGGLFAKSDIDITCGPVSTTTMPSVARWHAIEVKGQIAIFDIEDNLKIHAYAFKTWGNQKLKHEYEVLLQNNIRLTFKGSNTYGNMEVYRYNVRLA
ncbi:hypothetical protein [Saccharophagus degradans]|uniref:PAS/PAC sensor signal transduction histidine kinase n=1 Tax=Saccharophagus degradans (strain 2-40 / ATCC 43961 / DSM 17024) TaxID=203122 RepID=Q21G40_SACD2|nr:hypothetical protein [Saccharophagus degradans]ABD82339.1 PAS/PAC sensor signal transduction histidine kinase [Saccharophagus degradans 2-40]